MYMYDDHPWVPYEGTNLSISTFGFSGQMGRLQETAKALRRVGASELQVIVVLSMQPAVLILTTLRILRH